MRTKYITNDIRVYCAARFELASNGETYDAACTLYAAPTIHEAAILTIYAETNGDPIYIASIPADASAYGGGVTPHDEADADTLAWLETWCPDWRAAFDAALPDAWAEDWPGLSA